jgi:hypothetical protein
MVVILERAMVLIFVFGMGTTFFWKTDKRLLFVLIDLAVVCGPGF